jgi:hypothetical protein
MKALFRIFVPLTVSSWAETTKAAQQPPLLMTLKFQ